MANDNYDLESTDANSFPTEDTSSPLIALRGGLTYFLVQAQTDDPFKFASLENRLLELDNVLSCSSLIRKELGLRGPLNDRATYERIDVTRWYSLIGILSRSSPYRSVDTLEIAKEELRDVLLKNQFTLYDIKPEFRVHQRYINPEGEFFFPSYEYNKDLFMGDPDDPDNFFLSGVPRSHRSRIAYIAQQIRQSKGLQKYAVKRTFFRKKIKPFQFEFGIELSVGMFHSARITNQSREDYRPFSFGSSDSFIEEEPQGPENRKILAGFLV